MLLIRLTFFGMLCQMGLFQLHAQSFEFALIGDLPYYDEDSVKFDRLIHTLNADTGLAWVIHTGDVKSGSSPCSDEYLQGRYDWYQQFEHPFIITPGDNDWTDCHRKKCGKYDPLERLSFMRHTFYPTPGMSMGQNPMEVETQAATPDYAEYPENQMWVKDSVVFGTLHIVGSENGLRDFKGRTDAQDDEVLERTAANQAWLAHLFDQAQAIEAKGIFITIHANPGFEHKPGTKERAGFDPFIESLINHMDQFGKPVVVAHGDSHYFRYDKPLKHPVSGRRIESFSRLEAFGDRDVHWVRVKVNPQDPLVFSIRQELIPANFEIHE